MDSHLLFLDFSGGEFLLIAVVFLLFFGSKSIPEAARTMGKAIREFKEAANSVQRDIQQSAGLNEVKEVLNSSLEDKPAQNQAVPAIKPPDTVPQKEEPKAAITDGQTELPL